MDCCLLISHLCDHAYSDRNMTLSKELHLALDTSTFVELVSTVKGNGCFKFFIKIYLAQ